MFQKFNKSVTVKSLSKQFKEGKLRFDLAIQRNEVWDSERKSLFIHSLIQDYPFPPCYALDQDDDSLWFLDGKQRLNATLKFIDNDYALSENTPDVESDGVMTDVKGFTFKELPEDIQDEILGRTFLIYYFKNMSDDEVSEMFMRLNNGMPLTKMELTRVMSGSTVMKQIQEIGMDKFFTDTINITSSARNRFTDEELILQILSLVSENEAVELSSKALAIYATTIRDEGIPADVLEKVKNTLEYLNVAFPDKEKLLRKVNVPMTFMMAIKAKEDNIDALKFGDWIRFFLNDLKAGSPYRTASTSGSAKKENVAKRLAEMTRSYESQLKDVSDNIDDFRIDA